MIQRDRDIEALLADVVSFPLQQLLLLLPQRGLPSWGAAAMLGFVPSCCCSDGCCCSHAHAFPRLCQALLEVAASHTGAAATAAAAAAAADSAVLLLLLLLTGPAHLRMIFTVSVKPSWQMLPGTVMVRLTLSLGCSSRTTWQQHR
jgi:hypothetical protein